MDAGSEQAAAGGIDDVPLVRRVDRSGVKTTTGGTALQDITAQGGIAVGEGVRHGIQAVTDIMVGCVPTHCANVISALNQIDRWSWNPHPGYGFRAEWQQPAKGRNPFHHDPVEFVEAVIAHPLPGETGADADQWKLRICRGSCHEADR